MMPWLTEVLPGDDQGVEAGEKAATGDNLKIVDIANSKNKWREMAGIGNFRAWFSGHCSVVFREEESSTMGKLK